VDDDTLSDPRVIHAFWHHGPVCKALVSREGIIRMVNNAWFRMLGYSNNELVGKHFKHFTHPADIDVDVSEVKRLLADPGAEGYSLAKRYIAKSGSIVWVELHVTAIRDEQGRVDFFTVLILVCPDKKAEAVVAGTGLFSTYIPRFCDLILARPREFLVATVLGLFAIGRIPVATVVDLVKNYLAP
jgi:PAS domain S-box-containing protein